MFQVFSKKRKGYTLVEILVAITIIGILIGIAFVALGPAKKQGREARIISDLHQLQNEAENIYLDEGNYVNVSCAGSPQIASLCSDVAAQGSLIRPYVGTSGYCAFAVLDSATERSFCVDSSGSAKEIIRPVCSGGKYFCDYLGCQDFNQNGIVDCSGDALNPNSCTLGIPPCIDGDGNGTCDGSDIECIVKCFGAEGGSCTPSPPCPSCGIPGERDCLSVYDVTKDGDIRVSDIVATVIYVGTVCPSS